MRCLIVAAAVLMIAGPVGAQTPEDEVGAVQCTA